MANHEDYEVGGGSGFMVGLLTGTVLGAGLGMLLAPKSGSELRGQLSESASTIGRAASDKYQKVAGVAGNLAEKSRQISRDVMGRQKDAGPQATAETTPPAQHFAVGSTRS